MGLLPKQNNLILGPRTFTKLHIVDDVCYLNVPIERWEAKTGECLAEAANLAYPVANTKETYLKQDGR